MALTRELIGFNPTLDIECPKCRNKLKVVMKRPEIHFGRPPISMSKRKGGTMREISAQVETVWNGDPRSEYYMPILLRKAVLGVLEGKEEVKLIAMSKGMFDDYMLIVAPEGWMIDRRYKTPQGIEIVRDDELTIFSLVIQVE